LPANQTESKHKAFAAGRLVPKPFESRG
jgi:hypothetical protein